LVPVTVDNFTRAESDLMISGTVKSGGLGKFIHFREPMAIDCPIIRPNRDTLYSFAEFDLEAGLVTVTLPDPGTRFQTMIVIDQDHYVPQVIYGAGAFKFSKESIGGTTRYLTLGMRILVNPEDPADVAEMHKLQDAMEDCRPRWVATSRGLEAVMRNCKNTCTIESISYATMLNTGHSRFTLDCQRPSRNSRAAGKSGLSSLARLAGLVAPSAPAKPALSRYQSNWFHCQDLLVGYIASRP
jgi:hypothetical protein